MRCFLKGINRLRGLLKGSKPIKPIKQKKPKTLENLETEKPEMPLEILEVSEYVVWFCFDRVDPPTRLTLNCYLWLMNEYSVRTTGNPIASDAFFEVSGRYLECEAIRKEYLPGLIVPYTNHPDTAYMERISGILKLDWFLDGMIKFNHKNPFRLLELCREQDFDLIYNELIDCLK